MAKGKAKRDEDDGASVDGAGAGGAKPLRMMTVARPCFIGAALLALVHAVLH